MEETEGGGGRELEDVRCNTVKYGQEITIGH